MNVDIIKLMWRSRLGAARGRSGRTLGLTPRTGQPDLPVTSRCVRVHGARSDSCCHWTHAHTVRGRAAGGLPCASPAHSQRLRLHAAPSAGGASGESHGTFTAQAPELSLVKPEPSTVSVTYTRPLVRSSVTQKIHSSNKCLKLEVEFT